MGWVERLQTQWPAGGKLATVCIHVIDRLRLVNQFCILQGMCDEVVLMLDMLHLCSGRLTRHLQPIGRHDRVELVGDRLRDGRVASAPAAAAAAVAPLLLGWRTIAALLRRRRAISTLLRGPAVATLLRGVLLLAVALLLAAV